MGDEPFGRVAHSTNMHVIRNTAAAVALAAMVLLGTGCQCVQFYRLARHSARVVEESTHQFTLRGSVCDETSDVLDSSKVTVITTALQITFIGLPGRQVRERVETFSGEFEIYARGESVMLVFEAEGYQPYAVLFDPEVRRPPQSMPATTAPAVNRPTPDAVIHATSQDNLVVRLRRMAEGH